MTPIRVAVACLAVLAAGSCARRVVIVQSPPPSLRQPPPPVTTPPPGVDTRGPNTAVLLGIPPGHLPRPGECRLWVPGTPPGRQPGARSRRCTGIGTVAPPGSWIVYRPTFDRRLVHVYVVDERRTRAWLVRVYDFDSGRHLRDEDREDLPADRIYTGLPPRERPRDSLRDRREPPSYGPPVVTPPRERPADQGRGRPDSAGPPRERPGDQGRGRPDSAGPPRDRPADQGRGRPDSAGPPRDRPTQPPLPPPAHEHPAEPPGQPARADLDIPPGQMPQVGQCRVWIPGTPPGRQPGPRSRSCDGIGATAPAGSWILFRPTSDRRVVQVQVTGVRRFGEITEILIYDVETGKFVRQEKP